MTSNDITPTDLRPYIGETIKSDKDSSKKSSKNPDSPPPCAICTLPQYSHWRPENKTSEAREIHSIPVLNENEEGFLQIVMEKRLVHVQCYLNLLSATGGDVEP